jgi:hypothetical protein
LKIGATIMRADQRVDCKDFGSQQPRAVSTDVESTLVFGLPRFLEGDRIRFAERCYSPAS